MPAFSRNIIGYGPRNSVDKARASGWGCSVREWVFVPSGPPVGDTIGEMTRNFVAQRDKEFASHVCVFRQPRGVNHTYSRSCNSAVIRPRSGGRSKIAKTDSSRICLPIGPNLTDLLGPETN